MATWGGHFHFTETKGSASAWFAIGGIQRRSLQLCGYFHCQDTLPSLKLVFESEPGAGYCDRDVGFGGAGQCITF